MKNILKKKFNPTYLLIVLRHYGIYHNLLKKNWWQHCTLVTHICNSLSFTGTNSTRNNFPGSRV